MVTLLHLLRRGALLLSFLALLLVASGCQAVAVGGGASSPVMSTPQPAQPNSPTKEPLKTQRPDPSERPAPVEPEAEGEDASAETTSSLGYDFTQPAPEREAVERDYFDDAAFVGDSRTDGFLIYSGIGTGDNLTSNGLSIFKLEKKKALKIGGKGYTLMEALALKEYGKVYLSLGVNELGYFDDKGFYANYKKAIEDIRALQPKAVIYVQGLIPLNEGVIAQTGGRTYLTNEHLRTYNELMRQAAQETQVVYLDLYSAFVDENQELPAEGSRDGVHLSKALCQQWLTYLQTHTVDYATLHPTQETSENMTQEGA